MTLPLDTPPDPGTDEPRTRPTRRPIERSCYVHEADAFARVPPGCVCRSRSGYMRRTHTVDADGRCIFCDVVPLAAVRPPASFRKGR